MTFASPTPDTGDFVKIADLNGALCIFTPSEYLPTFATNFGDTAAVRTTIANLDEGTEHEDVLVFNKAIITSLKNNIGAQVLARVGQGVAKPGKSAPWILLDATGDKDAIAKATAYLTSKATSGITAPAEKKADATASLSPEALAALAAVSDEANIAELVAKLAKK